MANKQEPLSVKTSESGGLVLQRGDVVFDVTARETYTIAIAAMNIMISYLVDYWSEGGDDDQ